MKAFSLLCFAAVLGAAEVPTPDAKPREVTVYADRAEVVRIFQGTLAAGDQSLLFDNLPANVDFSSIRVEGTGAFTLVDIRPETVQVKEVANEAIRALQAKIQAQELIQKELALAEGRVAFRYAEEVNGSARNIAGIVSAEGNVLGMMPHPERALDATLGSTDGVPLFASILESMLAEVKA